MNSWATSLKLENTHFANAHGLDADDLYSTPYDIALLGALLFGICQMCMAYIASVRSVITALHSTTGMVCFVIEA